MYIASATEMVETGYRKASKQASKKGMNVIRQTTQK